MPISITRKIIDAIHNGTLSTANTFVHEQTGFTVPDVGRDFIPSEMLRPETSWEDPVAYKQKVDALMREFSSLTNN